MADGGTESRALRFRATVPTILVWYCRIVALLSILSALSPRTNERIDDLPDFLLYTVGFLLGVPSIGFGVLMLMLAAALRRRKRVGWWLLLAQAVFIGPLGWVSMSFLLYDLHWSDLGGGTLLPLIVATAVQLAFLGLIWFARPEFYAKPDSANLRFALVVLCVAFVVSAVVGLTLVHWNDVSPHTNLADQALYTLKAGMAGTGIWWYDTAVEVPHWVDVAVNFLGSLMILAVAWALFLPRRGKVLRAAEDDERLRGLLGKYGDQDSLGYFALRPDKAVRWSPSGKAAVAYRPVGGVSLAAGDPLGDVEAWPGAIDAWLEEAREHAWVPAVMGASEEGGRVFARHGLDAIELGDEAIIEVADFTLEGRAMRVVRQAYNRVQRAGYTTRIRRHSELGPEEMEALIAKADAWRDGAVERGFSMALGRLGDPADGQCLLVECLDGAGELKALLSFVPWGAKGLSLDLMRRDRASENGLVEFMVIDLVEAAQAEDSTLGVERISLNFAMFRSIFERANRLGAGPFLRLARLVLSLFSRWWQLESLYRANMKYRPVWEPRYLCFPKARDLARISIAAGRAEGFIAFPVPQFLKRKHVPKVAVQSEPVSALALTEPAPDPAPASKTDAPK